MLYLSPKEFCLVDFYKCFFFGSTLFYAKARNVRRLFFFFWGWGGGGKCLNLRLFFEIWYYYHIPMKFPNCSQ